VLTDISSKHGNKMGYRDLARAAYRRPSKPSDMDRPLLSSARLDDTPDWQAKSNNLAGCCSLRKGFMDGLIGASRKDVDENNIPVGSRAGFPISRF
jgi:hypothetical protein